jgi:hypothetical protein
MYREELWHTKLPLKLMNFIWLVLRNIIQTADNLSRKNCRATIFVSYVIVRRVWITCFFSVPLRCSCGQLLEMLWIGAPALDRSRVSRKDF